MLRGTRKYWLIAIIFGLFATMLFYIYMQDIKTRYSPKDLVQVVKARQDIPKDTVINVNAVELDNLPAQYVHPDVVRDKSAVVGKVATVNIIAGEQILNKKLLSSVDQEKRLAYSIPQSKRAVSVAVDNVSGVSGFIQAGDMVDVIAVMEVQSPGEQSAIPFSVLAIQNIQVLAVGENLSGTANSAQKGDVQGKTVTLAVSEEEAQRLALASEKGSIRLLLRSPVDKGTTTLAPFQSQEFLK